MSKHNEEREAEKRANELKRLHNLRAPVAETVAWSELGYSFSGVASKVDVAESTVKSRIESVEDRFGYGAAITKSASERSGPLVGELVERACPVVGCDASAGVHSVTGARMTFPAPSGELKRALEAAGRKGDTHVCVSCGESFSLADGDAGDSDLPLPSIRAESRWIAHRKSDKRPCAPWLSGDTDPVDGQNVYNQTDFATASEWVSKLTGVGLGIVPRAGDDVVAVDLDGCRDPESGEVDDDALDIVARLDSYTEVSISGTGLHVFVRGALPANVEAKEDGVEMYTRGQYVSVTFDHVDGTPTEARERPDALSALFSEYGGAVDRIEDRTPFDGEAPEDPFYRTPVDAVYPEAVPGRNVAHPIHGSDTGANFRVDGDARSKWRCWRHSVSGNVSQLLAMRYLVESEGRNPDTIHCGGVCRDMREDDGLFTEVWAWSVAEGIVSGESVPPRVDPSALPDPDE
jgi:hypothetical protein